MIIAMTKPLGLCLTTTLIAVASLGACVSTTTPKLARLANPNEATIGLVRSALRAKLGKPTLELGANDYRTATSVSVLPSPLSPLETRSLAVPTVYNIMLSSGTCSLVHATSGEKIPLTGVACVAVAAP
jgi:hypothetical protein